MDWKRDTPKAKQLRHEMIQKQLKARDIRSQRVLHAMEKVPRHLFGNFKNLEEAYADSASPIHCEQTISQPYMVAYMTQALAIRPQDKVLEIGTGSGYQTAILCELSKNIYSIERHPALAETSRALLTKLGYNTVHLVLGDGSLGYPAEAPFDRIMVTAAAARYPDKLINQLSDQGGVIVFPMHQDGINQELLKVIRHSPTDFEHINLGGVRFVPLVMEEP